MDNRQEFDLPGLLDVSAVQTTSSKDDVAFVASLAAKFNCKAAFALSGFLPFLKEERDRLGGKFLIGGTIGYPSGQTSTKMKCAEAKILVDFGADETDMVLNVGYLLSGMFQEALDDIKAAKQTVGDTPLKVIIEAPVLGPDDVKRAAELVVKGGAQWVKTGTGWAKTGTTLEHLRLIREAVGYEIGLKVAGGVGDLATIREMLQYKVGRFGIGRKARAILEEYEAERAAR